MALADAHPVPRKLWEHPDPENTFMWRFMNEINAKRGLNIKVCLFLLNISYVYIMRREDSRTSFWRDCHIPIWCHELDMSLVMCLIMTLKVSSNLATQVWPGLFFRRALSKKVVMIIVKLTLFSDILGPARILPDPEIIFLGRCIRRRVVHPRREIHQGRGRIPDREPSSQMVRRREAEFRGEHALLSLRF